MTHTALVLSHVYTRTCIMCTSLFPIYHLRHITVIRGCEFEPQPGRNSVKCALSNIVRCEPPYPLSYHSHVWMNDHYSFHTFNITTESWYIVPLIISQTGSIIWEVGGLGGVNVRVSITYKLNLAWYVCILPLTDSSLPPALPQDLPPLKSSPVAQCVARRAPMQQCVWWLVRAPSSS